MSAPRYHRMFERLVPRVQPFRGEIRLFSLKIERFASMGQDLRLVDAVVTSGQAVHAIPFIIVDGGQAVLPLAAAGYGSLAPVIAERVERWVAGKAVDVSQELDQFEPDAALRAAMDAPYALPGLVPVWRMFAEVDRYSLALTRASGRAVLDLNPGAGYGSAVLARHARSLTGVSGSPAERSLAQRLGTIDTIAEGDRPPVCDYVVALNVDPQRIEDVLQTANRAAPNALVLLSSAGEAGREALLAAGLQPFTLAPLALDAAPYFEEHLAWVEERGATVRSAGGLSEPAQAPASHRAHSVAERPLNILFALRPSAGTVFGGDVVQVRRTAQELTKRGHRVVVSTDADPQAAGFDLAHVSNMTVPDETLGQIDAIRGSAPGIPIVLMPIFTDHADETVWGMSAAYHAFSTARDEDALRAHLAALERRATRIPEWNIEPPPQRLEIIPGYFKMQREILAKADYLIANAYSEVHRIYRYVGCTKPFAVVPSCVDPAIYRPDCGALFAAKYGLADFVLTTGRIEPRKNQVALVHAMRARPERLLVVIGKNHHIGYGEVLRAYWPHNCIVLPQLTEEELAGAYAAARVVVQPSWDEVASLSALNAAACESSLVLTRNGYEHEYFGDDAWYCDPGSVEGIGTALDRAWSTHAARRARRQALAQRVRTEYTWDRCAELTERAYYRLLADREPALPVHAR